MSDPIALIIAYPDLSPEEMADLRRAIAADPVVKVLFACRNEIASSIRSDLHDDRATEDDSRLFALFSLYRAGRAGDLTPEEAELVAKNLDRVEAVLAWHPGLAAASDDVADAASEFSTLWDDHFEADVAAPESRPRTDRRAVAPSRRRSPYRWAVRTAIAVSVAAFAFILTEVIERDTGMLIAETAEDETRLIELGDGSRIRLLQSSMLSYPDPQSSLIRRAELDGRAFFEIALEDKGFIVETSTARITVLGTSFGVDAFDRLTEVVLTEGSLTLARSDKLDDLVVLEPGQMSRIVAGSGPMPPMAVDVTSRLAWTGLFIFQSTPLDEIARLLSEHFAVAIQVDHRLSDERVTGTFDQNQPLKEILDVIAAATGASVASDEADGYVLTHR